MGEASRIPASQKSADDFKPIQTAPVVKRLVDVSVKRASGEVEKTTIVLRPGDVLEIDGATVLEG